MALKVLASMTTAAWSRRAAPTMARLAALPAWQRRCYSSEGINVSPCGGAAAYKRALTFLYFNERYQ
eukprot:m.18257 g.18257  ORF g.18257 m.18257 type:complete len:67 (-) comp10778_c0_seq3:29-229(-)